jgi:Protein of unknown function (DUF3105)
VSKSAKTDRRAVIDQMRNKQKSAERARGMAIVGVCVLIAVIIVGVAAFRPVLEWWELRQYAGEKLEDVGAPVSACGDITTKPAEGTQDHVPPGTKLDILNNPPAFGQHYDQPDSMDRKFYSSSDRPELGTLIHNLEHGYTVVWYDEDAADDTGTVSELKAMAKKFSGTGNSRLKFKVVPWTDDDGDGFPKGQHIAYTHWSNGGIGPDATGQPLGVWQYCSEPSGEALKKFIDAYPYFDSPEPNGM